MFGVDWRMTIAMSRTVALLVCFVAVAVNACAPAMLLADNWPCWRGPNHNGISTEKSLPIHWTETQNVAWKLALPGMGGSTPAVWNDRIFLTCSRDKDLLLFCVSTAGKLLWERKVGVTTRDVVLREGVVQANEACASPSTDGTHVFALVGSGDLACFDFEGNEMWKCNIQQRYGKYNIYHGIHTSPLLEGDRLYLALLHSAGHWVVALDKKTGAEVWKLARPTDAKSESREAYTSPIIWDTGSQKHLIVHGSDYTTAHRLDDGSEVWRLELNEKKGYLTAFRMIATPICTPEMLLIPTTKNFSKGKGGPVIALKPGANGAVAAGSPFECWRIPAGAPDVSSPLLHDGLLYLCEEIGFLSCSDAKSGKEIYRERLPDPGPFRASPVLAEANIYLTGYTGTVTVVKAGQKLEIVAQNELADIFTASPAIANGRIYLHGYKGLYALEVGGK
jgi:outer membrane protein assembly factor BamB